LTLFGATIGGADVLEYVPEPPPDAYVTFRDGTENRFGLMGRPGRTLLLQAHVFVSGNVYHGANQAHTIIGAINAALEDEYQNPTITLADWDVVQVRPENDFDTGSERDADGSITWEHYIQTIRVDVLPT
jgi:hypothetical protein